MLNPISTELLNDFVSKRCEEILVKNKTYQNFNNSILAKEENFKKTLTIKQIMQFNLMEEEILNSISYAATIVYKSCLNDVRGIIGGCTYKKDGL